MLRFIPLLALLVSNCGTGLLVSDIDPVFQPYYQRFSEAAISEGIDITHNFVSIHFGTMTVANNPNGTAVAQCSYGIMIPEIKVEKRYWMNFPEDVREDLIFHELGHCVLDRDHDFDKRDNGWPVSIMYPILFSYPIEERPYYIHELFHP